MRRLVTSIPGPKSSEWLARKAEAVASGVGITMPVFAVAAGGGVLVDVDGNSLIDLGSGIAVTGVGNSAPRVVDAVQAQAARFTHTCFGVTPYASYVEVAEALNRLTPGDHAKRSALFNSGAEAVENAVKIARSYTGKQAIVAFDHAFHGRTNLAMALTAKNQPYKNGFGPFAPEIYRAPLSYPFRDGDSTALPRPRSTIDVRREADRRANLAAIIIEPIQGEGGSSSPPPASWARLLDWCRANEVVFIADEVQTGSPAPAPCRQRARGHRARPHRHGEGDRGRAAAVGGHRPGRDHGRAQPGGLGGTYSGNPIACAAALAAIRCYEEDGLIGRAQDRTPPDRGNWEHGRRFRGRGGARPRGDDGHRIRGSDTGIGSRTRVPGAATLTRPVSSCSPAERTATSSGSSAACDFRRPPSGGCAGRGRRPGRRLTPFYPHSFLTFLTLFSRKSCHPDTRTSGNPDCPYSNP